MFGRITQTWIEEPAWILAASGDTGGKFPKGKSIAIFVDGSLVGCSSSGPKAPDGIVVFGPSQGYLSPLSDAGVAEMAEILGLVKSSRA
jgi:hypothetical protein